MRCETPDTLITVETIARMAGRSYNEVAAFVAEHGYAPSATADSVNIYHPSTCKRILEEMKIQKEVAMPEHRHDQIHRTLQRLQQECLLAAKTLEKLGTLRPTDPGRRQGRSSTCGRIQENA